MLNRAIPILPPFLLFLLHTLLQPSTSILTISNSTISTPSIYTIEINEFFTTMPAGAIVQLELPTDYSSDDLHTGSPYAGNQFDGFCPVDCTTVGISYAGFIFNITGLFPTSEMLAFKYSIVGIPNPRTAVTVVGYTIRVIDLNSNVLYTESPGSRTFVPKTMTCVGTVTDFTAVGFVSTAYFTIIPLTNPRDAPMSIISIDMPATWSTQPITSTTLTTDIYCLSSSQAALLCQRSSQTVTVLGSTFGASIDFEIHSITNPTSMMSAGAVTITTMTSGRVKLDTCTIGLTGFTQDFLLMPAVAVSYTSDTLMTMKISASFPGRVAAGTVIQFTVPPELPLTGSACSAYLAGFIMPGVNPTYSSGTNTMSMTPFTTLIFKPSIELQCTGITRPRSAFTLGNVTIRSSYNGNTIAAISCCSTVLTPRSSLNVVSFLTDKPYLQMANAQYVLKLTNSIGLVTGDMLFVYFPIQYSIGVGTIPCTVVSPSAVLGTPTCTVSPGNLVKISSFLAASAPASTQFTFTLSSIQNPSSNPSLTPFQIHFVDSLKQTIEYSSTQYITISAAVISTLTVNSPNRETLYSPAQYVIQFVTNGILAVNYYVVVKLPVQVGVDQGKLVCGVGGKVWPCWYSTVGNIVEVRVLEALASNNVNFVLSGGKNPQSLAPTANFNIQILDPNRNIIEISSILLNTSIAMLTNPSFKYLFTTILSSNTSNPSPNIYEPNTLQLIAVCGLKLKSTHKLTLTYSTSQLIFNFGSMTSACSTGFICSFDTINGIITVTGLTIGSDTIYLNITNCIGLVMRPSITISLKTTTDYKIVESTLSVSQYFPDLITYTISQTSYEYAATTDLTIDYVLTSLSGTGLTIATSKIAYLLVYVPTQYTTAATGNLYNISTINGRVSIAAATNPTYASRVSSYFYLEGFGATGEIVAISVDNKFFQTVCDMPCRTCSTASNCLTCYSWYTLNLFYTNTTSSTSTCVSNCPRFYYQDTTTSTCKQCDSNCYECYPTNGLKCLSCPSTKFLYEVDFKCYADCPAGFYEYGVNNSGVCRACTSNCLICLNETYCMTCSTGLYLYGNKCILQCPPSTYSIVSPFLSCINCPIVNCIDCTQSQCLACNPPYYLSSNQCFLSCPFPLLPTISGLCKSCECATCSNYATNCTSCTVAKPYMYNNYCYLACPMGMYPGALNICTNCALSCLTCSGPTVCTYCKEGYALMSYGVGNVLCISTSTCPNTTILTLSTSGVPSCLPCTSPCLTCSTSVTFCLTCIDNYNFLNNSCLLTCPAPFHSISFVCLKCIPTCTSCLASDPYNCTQCQANYFLRSNACYSSCPTGTYTDILGKQCVQCSAVCQSCANSTNCTSCITGYFLFNWFCYTSCPTVPVMYYQYNGVCSACQPQCTSCINSPVACTACSHPEYLYNLVTKECVFQCTGAYFKSGSNCVGCQLPCLTCDTTFNSCSSCTGSFYLYNGTCVIQCPIGYYANSASFKCQKCIFPCKVCLENQCLLCQSFSYMYQKSCVLSCPADMPYEQPGYCSECVGIGFCARCTQSTTNSQICSQCVYPYVLFQGNCLNSCPVNYTANEVGGARVCQKSQVYLQYLKAKEEFNKPIIPPFLIFGLYLLACLVILAISHRIYRFTYHVGFMLGLLVIFNVIFSYYSLYFIFTRYEGQYIPVAPFLPVILIGLSIAFNSIILTLAFWIAVLRDNYMKDIRYKQWMERNKIYWWVSTAAMILLGGPRIHKLNYSKVFGLDKFSFRVVSVQKFYTEDILTYCSAIGDAFQVAAAIIIIYNVFIGYNGSMLIGYEFIAFKLVLWMLILYDLKKPDRGFFIGDQEEAEEEIKRELEQQEKKLNRIDTQVFAKLIRTKSQEVLRNKKRMGDFDVDDFISVYNPEDYEEVIKVPNKKIQKNIYKGKYRKGRKITIEQKLHKFVDSIKPKPVINKKKVDSYLHKLIYWKPPEMKKQKPTTVLPPSEQSMLALLEKKELQYKEDLDDIELVDEEKPRKYFVRPRYDQRTFLDDLDETIPNETVEFFYPSIDTTQKQNSIDFDDLMNLNYAKRKHLEKNEHNEKLEYESKRKLHHEPQKKRRNLKGFGQMVLRNQY